MPEGEFLQYGGQAVIEGVMMRSPRFFAVACRAANQEIVLQAEPVEKTWIGRQNWLKKPFLRGSLALLDAMALGIKALQFASHVQLDETKQGDGPPKDEPIQTKKERRIFWLALLIANVAMGAWLVPVVGSAILAKLGDVWNWLSSPKGITVVGGFILLFIILGILGARKGKESGTGSINEIAVGGAMVFGLVFGVLLFVVLPTAAVDAFAHPPYNWGERELNLLDGALRIFIFFDYIALIGQTKDIFRVFQYHGAEHKAINALEAGDEVTVENALKQTRIHPRCGTSFVVIVLVLTMLVLAFLPRPPIAIRIPLHLLMLFPIAGVAYELLRLAGRYRHSWVTKVAFGPGMLTQYLTTREPNPRQVEVAVASLKAVMDKEKGHAEEKLVVA